MTSQTFPCYLRTGKWSGAGVGHFFQIYPGEESPKQFFLGCDLLLAVAVIQHHSKGFVLFWLSLQVAAAANVWSTQRIFS